MGPEIESIIERDGLGSGTIFGDGPLYGTAQIRCGHAYLVWRDRSAPRFSPYRFFAFSSAHTPACFLFPSVKGLAPIVREHKAALFRKSPTGSAKARERSSWWTVDCYCEN